MTLDAETYELLGWGLAWPEHAWRALQHRYHRLEQQRKWASSQRVTKRNELAPCPGCGRQFDHRGSGRGWLRTFCSDVCRVKHHDRKVREERQEARPTSCGCCGAALQHTPGAKWKRYCNDKCRRRANR